jgi:phage shock protein PspC (stress-responsive transcriptional regulator)
MINEILAGVNTYFGVEPPSIRRRIIIGGTAITIVTVIDIILLVSWSLYTGSMSVAGSFASALGLGPGAMQFLEIIPPFSFERIVVFVLLMSFAFASSIVYYIILPFKHEERKNPFEGQYAWMRG